MRTLQCAVLTALILVLAGGCGQPAPQPGGEPGVSAPKSAPEEAPKAAPEKKQVQVGIVSPALTSMFHVGLIRGAKEEGERLGWKIESLAPDRETNFAAQIDMVEALVRRKVDAISICAINTSAIVGAIEKANAAGIPIFVHNSLTELPGGKVAAYVGYDQRKAGALCGEYAAECLKKKYGACKGEVYILLGVPGVHSTERSTGFIEALKPYPDVKVVDQTPANWERQQGMNVAAAALKATPTIDLFFGCSDAMAQGAAQAAREADKQVFTIGIDGNPDTLKDIKSGVVTATCAVFPDEMGAITIRSIKHLLDGDALEPKVETPIKIIDAANVDELLAKQKD